MEVTTNCGRLCGARQAFTSKRSYQVAIRENDLTKDGRCHYCGTFAKYVLGSETRVAAATLNKVRAIRAPEPQRVLLPYRRQDCEVVVQTVGLEFVYPSLCKEEVVESIEAQPEVLMGCNPSIPVECAPGWLVRGCGSPVKRGEVKLTQEQEFKLLFKRLVAKGRKLEHERFLARRELRSAKIRAAKAEERKFQAVVQLVESIGRKLGAKEALARLEEEVPLTREQEAFVRDSCRKAREESASMEAWLAYAKSWRKGECPHVAPKIKEPGVVPEVKVPWAHLDYTIHPFQGGYVKDGTLGAKNYENNILILVSRDPKTRSITAGVSAVIGQELPANMYQSADTSGKFWAGVVQGNCSGVTSSETVYVPEVSLVFHSDAVDGLINNSATQAESVADECRSFQRGIGVENCGLGVVSTMRNMPQVSEPNYDAQPELVSIVVESSPESYDNDGDSSDDEDDAVQGNIFDIFAAHSSEECEDDEDDEEDFISVTSEDDAEIEIFAQWGPVLTQDWLYTERGPYYKEGAHICMLALSFNDPEFDVYDDDVLRHIQDTIDQIMKSGIVFKSQLRKNAWMSFRSDIKELYEARLKVVNMLYANNWRYEPAEMCQERCIEGIEGRVQQLYRECFLDNVEPLPLFKSARPLVKDFIDVSWASNSRVIQSILSDETRRPNHVQIYTQVRYIDEPDEHDRLVREGVKYPYWYDPDMYRVYIKNIMVFPYVYMHRHDEELLLKRLACVYNLACSQLSASDCNTAEIGTHRAPSKCSGIWVPKYKKALGVAKIEKTPEIVSGVSPLSISQRVRLTKRQQIARSAQLWWSTCNSSCEAGTDDVVSVDCFSALPVFNRGESHLPLCDGDRDLTCNSGRGEAPSEMQERMSDRDMVPEMGTVNDLVGKLQHRRQSVVGAGENRVADTKTLTEREVFHQRGLLKRLTSSEKSVVQANLTTDLVSVRMAKQGEPVFTHLPRMTEEQMRKMLEMGIGSTSTVALDIGIQSHIPQGMPVIAFLCVMDARFENPKYASLCGSYLDLGRDRAKTLCLPLANFPLCKSIEDIDDVLNGLVLATFFCDPTSFSIGKIAFSYGVLEFQELKSSAYSDFTRVRESWDDIAKQQNVPNDRVIAGFSLLGAVSQDYNQKLPEFGEINLKTPPRNVKPPTTTFDNPQRLDKNERRGSFRLPSTGFNNTTRKVDVVKQYEEPQRQWNFIPHSSIRGKEFTEPRYAPQVYDRGYSGDIKMEDQLYPPVLNTCNSGFVADTTVAAVRQIVCTNDARANRVLLHEHLREMVTSHPSVASYSWIAKGLIAPKITFRLTMGSNPFVGISVGICLDLFGRVPFDRDATVLPTSIANSLPNMVFSLADGNEHIWNVDLNKLCGHSLFAQFDSFGAPYVFLYIVSDNDLPAAEDWLLTLEVLFTQAEAAPLALEPMIKLPYTFEGKLPLDVWRGPHTFALGHHGNKVVRYSLNFARREYNGQKPCINFPAAVAGFIQGHGGVLKGRIVHTGTRAVSCALHLCATWSQSVLDLTAAVLLPGVRLPTGVGEFSLKLQSPFERVSMWDPIAELTIFVVAGPTAAQNIVAPYEFMVHFDSLEADNAVPRVIGGTERFVWASFMNLDKAGRDGWQFTIPARLCNIINPDCDVTMFPNPLADLVASCGFMKGHMVITIMWGVQCNWPEPITGSVRVSSRYGMISQPGQARQLNSVISHVNYGTSIEMRVPVQNFSGFTASAATPFVAENFLVVNFSKRQVLTMVDIAVQLEPDFEFYGRSIALPLGV
uniref:Polyprotein n=1 Tax=Aloe haircap nepovirus TaxID=3115755 RepID=A0AAT9JIQ0_9SECO